MYKILMMALLCAGGGTVFAQTNWKLNTDRDGIKVYTGQFPDSKIKAVKVECSFPYTLSQLVSVILDVKSNPTWSYHTKCATLIKQVSPSEIYSHAEISLPWPAQNRDYVAHIMVSQNPITRVLNIDAPAVPGIVPKRDGIVRINNSAAQWTVTPVAGQINIVYILHVDPGGGLPAWLVNMSATAAPFKMFKGLRKQLDNPEYKNVQLSFIAN